MKTITITVPEKEAEEMLQKYNNTPWRAKKGERYYYAVGAIVLTAYEEGENIDTIYWRSGNYHQTEEETKKRIAYREAKDTVRLAILAANQGWKPDWANEHECKYRVFYNHEANQFQMTVHVHHQECLGLPYAKNNEIVQSIIKDYENELKVIWGLPVT